MRFLRIVVLVVALLLLLMVARGLGIGYASPQQREHTEGPGIQRLSVEDGNAPIDLKPSADGSTRIEYTETRFVKYEITREGDELHVTMRDSRKWYDFIDFRDSGRRLAIYVPESLVEVNLRTSNGGVTMEAPQVFRSLDIRSSNGRIRLTGANVLGSALLKTSNGGIDISDAVFNEMLTLNTSNGELSLDNVELQTAEIGTSNSRIRLDDVDVAVWLHAATSNGGIHLSRLTTQTGSLTLNTSNGPVEGSIASPRDIFAITSKTSNADNNLPSSWEGGPAKLDIRTSNGRIQIEFE